MVGKKPIKREYSAGGVVFKKENTRALWLVCKHSGYHQWILPKGIIEEGERAGQTAVREVLEETGVKAEVVAKIPEPETYFYHQDGQKIFKKVSYFLMKFISGQTKDHSWEMEEVRWLPYQEALATMKFEGAKKVLTKAKKILAEKEGQPSLL